MDKFDEKWHDDAEAAVRAERFFRTEYHDRGMVKWQGFFLSDHTEDVQKYTNRRQFARIQQRMPELSAEKLSDILVHAYANHRRVRYQAADKIDNLIPPVITDIIIGLSDDKIIFENTTLPRDYLWWAEEL